MQGAQLAEMEALYKEEQVLRKRYFNTIEGGLLKYRTVQSVPVCAILVLLKTCWDLTITLLKCYLKCDQPNYLFILFSVL